MAEKKEDKKMGGDPAFGGSELFGGGLFFLIVSVIVWLLAIFWHPYGEPLPAWHWTNGIVAVVFLIITIIGYSRMNADKKIPNNKSLNTV